MLRSARMDVGIGGIGGSSCTVLDFLAILSEFERCTCQRLSLLLTLQCSDE